MSRALRVVSAEPLGVLAALRDALSGDGPAILPRASGHEGRGRMSRADGPRAVPDTPGPVPLPDTVEQRIALVVETSGSTGVPKRVALSSDALLASAAASEAFLGAPGQWLLALPAHYIAGINVLVRSLSAQTDPVIMPPGPFTAGGFIAATSKLELPTRFVSLVPAQLARLLESDQAVDALHTFSRVLVGGQSMPRPLLDRATELGVAVTRTYGSSETSGGCVYDGEPIGNTELRIEDGRIEIAGSVLAEGYLGDPAATASAFRDDHAKRWYVTGDTGELIDGVLKVTGRVDDVIVSGGVKVSLAAVERIVRGMPRLEHAVVVAAPSEAWGQVPVVAATSAVDLAELRATVTAALGREAVPARVLVVAELPMLESGKPDRVALTRLALQ